LSSAHHAATAPAPALDHVQVAAPPGCEPQARRFYGELLGLVELEKPAPLRARGGAWFALGGGAQLHIGVEDPFTPARKAHPALRVTGAGLRVLADRLQHAGAPVTWDQDLAGLQRFFTADPWGNRLELLGVG
jgi:catechol 2,3-dioxygenase-like lactoylglutathione lyase family enzyme